MHHAFATNPASRPPATTHRPSSSIPSTQSTSISSLFRSHLLPPAAQTARLAICETCDKNLQGNCALCRTCGGRPVAHKVRLSTETCPLGKWPPLEPLANPTLAKNSPN